MRKLLISLLVLFGILLFPTPSFAKSYTIDDANIDIVINKDGSANIQETRTYTFSGHFENGWWSTGTKKACTDTKCDRLIINNLQIKEGSIPINFTTKTENNQQIVSWKYTADDETKDFTVFYTIENAVNNYLDTAEFYWQIIQEGWGVPTQNLIATIHLPYPSPNESLKAWGHGPLTGKVSILDAQTVIFSAKNIPADTFVEGRVLFPKLPGVSTENENALGRIVNEEANWINETINTTKTSAEPINYAFVYIVLLITGLLFLARFIYWLIKWGKVGKDLPLPVINLAGSLHEPPSNTEPAIVEAILNPSHTPTAKSITATILELCRKKLLKISQEYRSPILGIFPQEPEIWFELQKNKGQSFTKNEEDIIHLLYLDEETKISKSKMLSKLKTNTKARSHFQSWKSQFEDILLKNDFLDKKSHTVQGTLATDIAIGIVFGAALLIIMESISQTDTATPVIMTGLLIQFIIFAIGIGTLSGFMDRLTPKGAQEKASWIAFKKYLKDYSVTKKSPLESVIIWEKYLVYGAALGISLKALSELPLKFGDEARSSFVYLAAMNTSGNNLDLSSIGSGLESVSTSFASFGASGTGSSGGFSGGGGGGGGGGSGGGMS